MKFISVILPVYNSDQYLKDSIESILNQTYKNFEFIIINDGSTDNSLKIIKEYAQSDNRIKVVSRENKGLVYSLNEGISLAKGEYIARMDSDDISMPQRLEKQLQYMIKNKDVDVLASKVKVFGDEDKSTQAYILDKYCIDIYEKTIEYNILKENIICHPSVIMKHSYLNKIGGYREKYYCAEDYDLWLRSIKSNFRIRKIDEALVNYRIHKESKVRVENKNYGTLKDMINIKLDYIEERLCSKDIKYLIWGASNGGNITKDIVEKRFQNSKFIGFVDKFKEGEFIYKPNELKDIDFNYAFIATQPGKFEAESILNELGYSAINDYLWTI